MNILPSMAFLSFSTNLEALLLSTQICVSKGSEQLLLHLQLVLDNQKFD